MAEFSPVPQYSERYDLAVQFALAAHRYQQRKYSGKPYILHLQAVSSYVWLEGGTEAEAIAAWLHDYVEDAAPKQGLTVDQAFAKITDNFGSEVAAIVRGCTECDRSLPWQERKQEYIEQVASGSDSIVLVSLADKYDNYTNGYLREGFSKTPMKRKAELIWFGESLAAIYSERFPESFLARQFLRSLEQLKGIYELTNS
ncbi:MULTISPECIES: HD domain-containing protein [Planktothricoides]|uniref:HD domain-containing protein n=2 Tax=Planktothricoides raciborskii TaxID=132608 RepID=A0AAU8JET9_9CYAN|nr:MULTISPECIES: HD domain-containing protein [Planktothricoides]KOR35848.1 hypothetical protein AM228_16000 [Planktothricoides sp. SR001]MBD2544257.1 HD domain-containing protein [Planktothricoides raciborskii FACHB-1370]MBD2583609.1 HD domain-containing protein [Planktothricoides raciborskii FACHB-1261]